ncbi:hypothetical protein AAZX31_05G184900 [Glycine max]
MKSLTYPTGRTPYCDKEQISKKGPWSKEEDEFLINYINLHGEGNWKSIPKAAGLLRCGKSCRLRWTNYLRPDVKKGKFTEEESNLIIHLHSLLGNKNEHKPSSLWSQMARSLPGRTDNEIKNYWKSHLKRYLTALGIDPVTHKPFKDATTTPPTNNSQVSMVTTTSKNGTNNTDSNIPRIYYFNVFLNSKVQISADHDCSADGADSNGSSGVTIEEASPQVNLELSIAPPSQPEDASMKETLNG